MPEEQTVSELIIYNVWENSECTQNNIIIGQWNC